MHDRGLFFVRGDVGRCLVFPQHRLMAHGRQMIRASSVAGGHKQDRCEDGVCFLCVCVVCVMDVVLVQQACSLSGQRADEIGILIAVLVVVVCTLEGCGSQVGGEYVDVLGSEVESLEERSNAFVAEWHRNSQGTYDRIT